MTPQQMIETILEPSFEGDGVLANDLLKELGPEFPKENVRPLIASPNPETQATAAFLMTFWGFELHPFVSEIATLLESKHSRARFDVTEVLLGCTTPDDGEILGRVLLLLDDPHIGVRWKVAQWICVAQYWQLRLAGRHAARLRPNSAFEILEKFCCLRRQPTSEEIRWLIQYEDPIVRRFGAALSIRPLEVIDERFLTIASMSDDAEVAEIVESGRGGFMAPGRAIFSSRLFDDTVQPGD
ncbi:hypothetical protein C1M53_17625 [Mesorhizobium sp. Pch-S]|nr:hypothetical protein C1M53_17625 [Mesorhizobium sp. Pch-S]